MPRLAQRSPQHQKAAEYHQHWEIMIPTYSRCSSEQRMAEDQRPKCQGKKFTNLWDESGCRSPRSLEDQCGQERCTDGLKYAGNKEQVIRRSEQQGINDHL